MAAGILPLAGAGTVIPFEHQLVLYAASATESFTGGLGTAAFLAFLMAIVRKDRAATEYALLSSVFALSRSVAGWVGGLGAQSMGYGNWFLLTFFLALPGLPAVALGQARCSIAAPRTRRPPRLAVARPDVRRYASGPVPLPIVTTRMNHHKYVAIAHRDHDYCNPLSSAKFERLLDLLPLDAGLARARPRVRARRARAAHHRALRLDRDRDRPLVVHARCRARARRMDRRARPAAPRRHRHPRLPRRSGDVPSRGDARRGRHRRAAWRASARSCAAGRAAGGYVLVGVALLEAQAAGRARQPARRARARRPRPPRQRAGRASTPDSCPCTR